MVLYIHHAYVGGGKEHPMGGYFGNAPLTSAQALQLARLGHRYGVDAVQKFKNHRESQKEKFDVKDNSKLIDLIEIGLETEMKK